LPNLFTIGIDGDQHMARGRGWIVVSIVFGLERALILFALLLNAIIPTISRRLQEKLGHEHYVLSRDVAETPTIAGKSLASGKVEVAR